MKNPQRVKQAKKLRRIRRVRSRVFGTKKRPRLAVYRSLKHIYVQLIDDASGKTLAAVSDFNLPTRSRKGKKTETAKKVGLLLAQKAKEKNISAVIFDRRGYKYHGRIKSLAEGAREGGLRF